ncbi:hypothetical protein [Agrococcus sp. SGAir0287]|uniref:hypothetical protein n=1 Tax=Agrococcus sp. SGAir0287 TaxID=2070347 RepID=UPI0010CCD8DB|nr:hypothetical protein [Agrococcus sp. SGAir0287]QCR18870.1 hypothetical protein C1N71_04925 [Agrococcus sp. SGAir0287]
MTSLAARLLAGPRGRRLCLDVAMHDDRVREAVFWAAWAIERDDPAVGTTWIALDGPGSAAADAVPHRSVDDVVQAILASHVDVDAAVVDAALSSAVSSARYWQEPDADDRIASDRVVSDVLAPIAEAVAASDHWLRDGRARGSWLVRWDETPPRTAVDLTAARAAELADDEAMRAHPLDAGGVPVGGAWWSTPQTPETVGRLPIALALVEDELGWQGATAIAMREPDRLLRIASIDDWLALCRAHPLEVTFARRHDWTRTTGERHASWIVPDWVAVAAHHDAVHLDVRCWLEGAGRALRVDDDAATVIAGWSPDATCWLRDPQPVDGVPSRRFARDDAAGWVELDA